MAYVYRHIRLDKNEPFYIGISNKNSSNYERAYSNHNKTRNRHWVNIYNSTQIEVEILFENVSYDFAKKKEIEFIAIHKKISDGGTLVNLTDGGDGVLGLKNPKLSERNKLGIWKGKKHTEETKKIMSFKNKGRIISKYAKKCTSERNKIIYKGVNNPKYRGIVYVYNLDKILYEATFPIDAANYSGLSVQYVDKCLCTNTNGYKGFYFTRNINEIPESIRNNK